MRNCELCKSPAKIFCESDQASLCWDCDARVHGANFLVARHSRSLLCHACCSPTPWTASGPKLGHTVSLCECCVYGAKNRGEKETEEQIDGAKDEVGYGDHQAVAVAVASTPSPPAASSSSSEGSVNRFSGDRSRKFSRTEKPILLKRMRQDLDCSSSQRKTIVELTADSTDKLTNSGSLRRWKKDRRIETDKPISKIDLNLLPDCAGV